MGNQIELIGSCAQLIHLFGDGVVAVIVVFAVSLRSSMFIVM